MTCTLRCLAPKGFSDPGTVARTVEELSDFGVDCILAATTARKQQYEHNGGLFAGKVK